ncbi:unnamed protein product [Malus baccata var. baccata]
MDSYTHANCTAWRAWHGQKMGGLLAKIMKNMWFMTRSSQPIHKHIRDFDDDFERTLRRARNQQEPQPSQHASDLGEDKVEEQEEPTAQVVEEDPNIAADNRTIKELSASGLDNAVPLCIQYPMAALGKMNKFELKSSLLHHIPKFHGMSMEDPNKHLKEFEVVCSSMTPVNVDGSILKMKAFPFSLLEKAKDWLYELAPGTVTSWESMKRAFFMKISGIQQNQGESFPTYYERFKTLVASSPQHQMLDASAGGALVDKTPMAAKTLIANRALNAQQYEGVGQRDTPQQQVNEMAEGMRMKEPSVCGVCSIQGHASEKCPQLIENGGWESANAIGFQGQNQPRNNPYSNTYNPGWRDHPNFRWREPQQPQQQGGFRQQPPGFYTKQYTPTQAPQQPAQNTSGTSLDNETLLKLLTNLSQGQENQAKAMQNQEKRVDQMEKQIGQIAEFVGQFREQGKLPSSTVVNENGGFESAKSISLRSGNQVGSDPQPSNSRSNEVEELIIEEEEQSTPTERVETPLPQAPKAPKPSNSANKVPFPRRFMQSKKEEAEKDILETFRKVQVNIPLLDAIKQVPRYAKFLKELCTTRKRISSKEVVKVNHLIFSADFYVLEMDESDHSPTLPILIGQPFMKTAQTKIDIAKGSVTMTFGGDMISFNIPESVENTNDVRFCCANDVIENIGQKRSTLIKKKVLRTTIEEEIGVNNKECTTTLLKTPILIESNPCSFVDSAATSLQHIGTSPNPISIPISTNRYLIECKVVGKVTSIVGSNTPKSGRTTIPFRSRIQCVSTLRSMSWRMYPSMPWALYKLKWRYRPTGRR